MTIEEVADEPEPLDGSGAVYPVDVDADEFDFDGHRKKAVADYQKFFALYSEFAGSVEAILRTCLESRGILTHTIESRVKSIESFGRKATKPAAGNPNAPKYRDPLQQITDLAAVRVITYFLSVVDDIDPIIREQFDIRERTDKSELLKREERLGYHSVHYLVRLKDNRYDLPEYRPFRGLTAEIQVREGGEEPLLAVV